MLNKLALLVWARGLTSGQLASGQSARPGGRERAHRMLVGARRRAHDRLRDPTGRRAEDDDPAHWR